MKILTVPLLALGATFVAGCAAPVTPEAAPVAQTEGEPVQPVAVTPAEPAAPTKPVAAPKPTVAPVAVAMKKPATTAGATQTAGAKPDTRYRVAAKDLGPDAPPVLVAALAKASVPPPPANFVVPAKARVVMQTSRGPITVELDGRAAPLHVKSFLYLANRGFFNGTKFHRHADLLGNGQGFIIQGGDPFSKSTATAEYAGTGGPGYEIPRERNKLVHNKLVIAAARSQDPDSAGSQFYITQGDVPFLDEGDGYTVFGKVVAGQDAASKLVQDDTLLSASTAGKTTKR